MDWNWFNGDMAVVFSFVIAIVLINAIAGVFKSNQLQKTVREAMKSGQQLDAKTIAALGLERASGGGSVTGGFVLIAVAAALLLLGYFGGGFADEPNAVFAMLGVAAFPGLIGVVLVISGMLNRGKD